MQQKPRIVFMGTPEFAVANLKALIENGYNVVGVITAPDKPAGRGKKLRKSAVKLYAESLGLPVLQPTNLKSGQFIKELKALQPDLQIVAAFRMLPEVVWRIPKHGTFNLHASLLPDYRGAAPINWAIINGETKTGVTTFFIDDKIDTGEIILQKSIEITPEDNASSLHDKLMDTGSLLVMQTVDLISNSVVKTTPQPKVDLPKKAPKLHPENTRINWQESGINVHNLIRGLSEYPGAWTKLSINNEDKKKFFIYKSRFEPQNHDESIGQISFDKKSLKIAVKDGYIYPEIVKLQGKKMLPVKDFLNGVRGKELQLVI